LALCFYAELRLHLREDPFRRPKHIIPRADSDEITPEITKETTNFDLGAKPLVSDRSWTMLMTPRHSDIHVGFYVNKFNFSGDT
jgi:hypothetical protein